MISATGVHRSEGFQYAIDNGAWTAHNKNEPWDEDAFSKLLESHGADADFIVVPDIVAGGRASLRFSAGWLPRLPPGLKLLAVQDGMETQHIAPLLRADVGIFLGGSTEWKLATMPVWGRLARECGVYFHVGRVNSIRRIRMCALAGADSFDGSGVSRFAVELPKLDAARKQKSWTF